MSYGGSRVIDVEYATEGPLQRADDGGNFILRRFETGGRLKIKHSKHIRKASMATCVLCGNPIGREQSNYEHPLPQWLYKIAGEEISEFKPGSLKVSTKIEPTWRQLCLKAHTVCNSKFAENIEFPARSSLKSILAGERITWSDLDRLFDWLDKVKSTAAHMATALLSHAFRFEYGEHCFPNRRIGLFDRLALFFRVSDKSPKLELWDCLTRAFRTTPSAIILMINDLVIVYVSANYILSPAFGLPNVELSHGLAVMIKGSGNWASGFGSRDTRLPTALVLAQPMRRQHKAIGIFENNSVFQENGDGKVFSLSQKSWNRVRNVDFSSLPVINFHLGLALATLEIIEWTIISKEADASRYVGDTSFFMKSMVDLYASRGNIMQKIRDMTGLPIF
jgi:hypothetical protein